jgi:hypothetical protein
MNKSGRAWKMTRASVHKKNRSEPRSNKYTKHDHDKRPAAGTRGRVWVGGYTRRDGTRVEGHYRNTSR